MISHIHHINFLVRDLDLAIARYQCLLGDIQFELDELKHRTVKTARVKLGSTWLILVQPLDDNSVPAQHLAKYGEGFFLMSLATTDLPNEKRRIESEFQTNLDTTIDFQTPQRTGLDGWQVIDFPLQQFFGAQLQLTQDKSSGA